MFGLQATYEVGSNLLFGAQVRVLSLEGTASARMPNSIEGMDMGLDAGLRF